MASDTLERAYWQGREDGEGHVESELVFALDHPETGTKVAGHLVMCRDDCPHEDH